MPMPPILIADIGEVIQVALLGLILLVPFAVAVQADELLVDSVKSTADMNVPRGGMTMDEVRAQFGNPVSEEPTVSVNGGPQQPPITRWNYNDYSVVFENDRVVHSVVHHTASK